jgi:hypothetical protein
LAILRFGRGNYISGEGVSRENLAVLLTAEVSEEPEEERKDDAENEAGNDREIESGVFAAMDDISGKFAEAERDLSAEIEKSADGG